MRTLNNTEWGGGGGGGGAGCPPPPHQKKKIKKILDPSLSGHGFHRIILFTISKSLESKLHTAGCNIPETMETLQKKLAVYHACLLVFVMSTSLVPGYGVLGDEYHPDFKTETGVDPGKPLFLTPYIEAGNIEEGNAKIKCIIQSQIGSDVNDLCHNYGDGVIHTWQLRARLIIQSCSK